MPPLTAVGQKDFSGGINAVSNPYVLGEKQVLDIENMLLDEHGSLRTRDGYSVVTTAPNGEFSIRYRGVLTKTDGSSAPFAIRGRSPTLTELFRTDTDPWTLITSWNDTNALRLLPMSVTVIDREIIARGYNTPLSFDGTTASPITAQTGQTVPPGGQHISFHLGSVWLWNTSPTTTALDGPSSLRMSDVNNPNSWPNANQTFVAKDDGQVGMGMATFTIAEAGISPTQTLVLFKNYSTYQVTGVFGSSSFSVQKVKTDMGCIAPRTIQFVSGFGIIRLTHRGFALFNGVDDRLISEEVRPHIFGGTGVSPGLHFGHVELSWAVQSQNPPLYIAACPTPSDNNGGLSILFVYDLVRRTWSICRLPTTQLACMTLFALPSQRPVIHAGTFQTGQILSMFNGDQTDAGAAIPWRVRTRPFHLGSPTRYTFWRRALVDIAHQEEQTITVKAIPLAGSTVTKTVVSPGAGSDLADNRLDIDILQTAPAVTLEVSGTTPRPVRIRAVELHARPKPPTRAVK